jgi:PAS domain S-box-containing protein
MPRERIDERAWALRRGELSALALIGLFGLFIAWQAGEIMLLDKIRRLRDAAAHWTAGDLSWRTLIRPGQGELRQLAGDLDAMAEALATLTHHHATLLNAAGEGIYGLDAEGKVTFVNPAAAALLGYRREELQGRKIAESIGPWRKHAQTAVRVAAEFPLEIDPGQVQRLESLVFVGRDGTELPVDVARAPVHVHGRQVGVVDVFFDRRARDQAESALRQSEGRLRAIIEAAPDALFIVDAAGKITFANDQAAQLTGYPKRELLDRSVETLMPAQYRASNALSRDAFRGAQGEGTGHARREVPLLRKDGSGCIVEISLASFTADGGPQFVAMARDVSARKRVEADMRETNESLERRVQQRTAAIDRAYRDLESFSYSVAHDLRAPLRAINGFTHLVLEREFEHLSPSSRELFDRVVRNARKMDELIEDVLRYSRSTTQLAELVQVDMNQLAGQCVSEFQPQYPEARIDLQPLPAVRGDPAMLRQVWFNLIGNALKFSALRPEPKVEIGCRLSEECVFYVTDNGIGFEMSQADKLFGMFQRLHAGEQFHGTGVGLAIVRRLLERQGGQIWAKSEPGRGATFYFTLGECIPPEEAPIGEIR